MSVYVDSEVYEAIDAANEALNNLYAAKEMLSSARNWGLFDMLGGGMISTFIKRKKMANAQKLMDNAKQSLENFKDELDDVFELNLKMDDFISFADIFFDGWLFGDWMVQGRINEAMDKINKLIYTIENIRKQLQEISNS